ncbi:MAG: hypothetical protein Kow0099_19290 [Candidatus Abyssubacteria bacterium]
MGTFLRAALALLLASAAAPSASADEIYFKSGYSRTVVVLKESEDSITFMTEMGVSTISRDQVDFIEKVSDKENQELRRKWRERELQEKKAQEERRAARRKYEQEQLAKGLIKFEDKWMTPEEKQELLDLRQRAKEHFARFESEQKDKGLVKFKHLWVTPQHYEELSRMETEIYDLYYKITTDKRSIDGLRDAMAKSASFEEAEKFSTQIKKIQESIEKDTTRLGDLLKRADEIEAASVRYRIPAEFEGVLPPANPDQRQAP